MAKRLKDTNSLEDSGILLPGLRINQKPMLYEPEEKETDEDEQDEDTAPEDSEAAEESVLKFGPK